MVPKCATCTSVKALQTVPLEPGPLHKLLWLPQRHLYPPSERLSGPRGGHERVKGSSEGQGRSIQLLHISFVLFSAFFSYHSFVRASSPSSFISVFFFSLLTGGFFLVLPPPPPGLPSSTSM